jgi:hypothetical protein
MDATLDRMDHWRRIGAENNARWCDLVVRSHGGRGVFSNDAWTSSTRTPPLFPDAVSLVPSLSLDDLLSRIDISPGCTIKDSFASLDLTTHGFRVLLDAQWITSGPAPGEVWELPRDWTQVTEPDDLDAWEQAWRGNDGPSGLFKPTLLTDGIAVLGRKVGGRFVAGAIVSRCEHAAGVSNVFTVAGDPSQTWSALAESARAVFPGLPLVGYEGGEGLSHAMRSGFATAGRLRVWIAESGLK